MESHLSDDTMVKRTLDPDSDSIDSEDEILQHGGADPSFVSEEDHQPLIVKPVGTSTTVPVDRYNLIYIIFFIQGVGMLLPWNFFITAKSYFDYKLDGDEYLQDHFENIFALSAMGPAVISLFINIFLTGRVSRGCRITTCLIIMFASFVVTTAMAKVHSQKWPGTFFAITIFIVVVVNVSTGIYNGTIFGIVGIMGSRYTQSTMSGQALAGIFAAVADLITKLTDYKGTQPTRSAFIYFLIASIVIAITLISYLVLQKLPQMQSYLQHEDHSVKLVKINGENCRNKSPKIPYWLIFKQIMPLALSVCFVFVVTLALFPALISKIESVNKNSGSRWSNDLFPTLTCFLIFNCGDWAGRIIAGYLQIVPAKGIYLPLLCISRIIFVPLFLFCNIPKSILPYLFKHDAYPIVINILFSVSNGYLGSLCMMFGPKLVRAEHAETAGTIMSLFLNLGLSIGSCLSFAL